jgi:hypothetical protein
MVTEKTAASPAPTIATDVVYDEPFEHTGYVRLSPTSTSAHSRVSLASISSRHLFRHRSHGPKRERRAQKNERTLSTIIAWQDRHHPPRATHHTFFDANQSHHSPRETAVRWLAIVDVH